MQQTMVMYESKNRKSDELWEFGRKNRAKRSSGSKYMGFGSFAGKTVFSEGYVAILEFFEWLEGLGAKDRSSYKVWWFFRGFCGIFEGLEWFRTYS
jgi:hypothetical protein